MLFESLPTEPDTAGWFTWCHDHDVAVYLPAVDGPDLRVQPGDLDPAALDVVVVRAWRSRSTAAASARVAGTSTASCRACAPAA